MPQPPADLLIALRVLVALVFLVAGTGKLGHRVELEGVIANYRVLPRALAGPLARVLGPLEILLGLGLLAGPFGSPAAESAAALLLVAFAIAMGINLRRGRAQIDCGCFRGTLRQRLRGALVLRNLGLAGAAILCALLPSGQAGGWQLANGLLGGIALFLLLQGMNALWAIDTQSLRARGRPAWARQARA